MSTSSSPSELLQAAAEVAQLAGRKAMRWYRTGVDVETKSDGSPVTIADREAERVARAWLSERFPDDSILGEEFGVERPEARRRWLIDPLCGTLNFAATTPLMVVNVALLDGERTIAAAAADPVAQETPCY